MPCINFMKGIILVNAYAKNKSQISQAQRICAELKNLGENVDIVKNTGIGEIAYGKTVAYNCDYCVFLDKDKAAARIFEKSGVKLFNRAKAIENCDDKMLTHIELANNGIPMPHTLYAPLCYTRDSDVSQEFLNSVEKKLGFPLIAKKCYGSLGSGVYMISDAEQLRDFEESNKLTEHLYQQFIGNGTGEDLRVIVIGGKFVCAMKRINCGDFRSNIELGGHGEMYSPDKSVIKLAEKVADVLQLDYCGIDVLFNSDGSPTVCEVNSNAFFAEAEKICGVNIAETFAKHIVKQIKNI